MKFNIQKSELKKIRSYSIAPGFSPVIKKPWTMGFSPTEFNMLYILAKAVLLLILFSTG